MGKICDTEFEVEKTKDNMSKGTQWSIYPQETKSRLTQPTIQMLCRPNIAFSAQWNNSCVDADPRHLIG
ncbi:hypothetical protein KIN20_014922 [Parelaphostrongylus tenuis]|uniref:Uncharacterized protein n=1 Tax=Parelaphostrongylus tenuis TaxID=148309 RepID=A0AAD5QNM8_PARTN|nr:hypothetical protein KIN20_014922 [Parelaphostrongylus tenuis]